MKSYNPKLIKRSQLETLLKGIIKEVVGGMRAIEEASNSELFSHVPVNTYFRIPGYDDLFQKIDDTRAVNHGSGLLNKPTKLGRKGQKFTVSPDTMVSPNLEEQSGAGAAGCGGTGASVTANVSPVTTPYAFKKKRTEAITPLSGMEEEGKKDWGVVGPPKRLFNPKAGVYPADFKSVPNYVRIKKSQSPGEFIVAWFVNGKFNDDKSYYTTDLGDAYDTLVAMKPQVDAANGGVPLKEMTGTMTGTPGYNIPGCFAKVGGSKKGIEGSESIGYTLTPIGKDDMGRHADKLLEGKDQPLTHGKPICKHCKKEMHYAGQASCTRCGKSQGPENRSGEASHAKRFATNESQGFGSAFDKAQRAYDARSPEEEPSEKECEKCGAEAVVTTKSGRKGSAWWWEGVCKNCGHKMSDDNF